MVLPLSHFCDTTCAQATIEWYELPMQTHTYNTGIPIFANPWGEAEAVAILVFSERAEFTATAYKVGGLDCTPPTHVSLPL